MSPEEQLRKIILREKMRVIMMAEKENFFKEIEELEKATAHLPNIELLGLRKGMKPEELKRTVVRMR